MDAGFIKGLADQSLDALLEFFYEGLSGYVFLGTLESNENKTWVERTAYNWPVERDDIKSFVVAFRKTRDVYISPAVFSAPVHKKEAFKASNVAWAEYDPYDSSKQGEDRPTLRIQSSEGKEHHYYRMIKPFENYEDLERTNKAIAYRTGADKSGWDCVQLLRPIGSYNHKYGDLQTVKVIEASELDYPTGILDSGYTAQAEHEVKLTQVMPTVTEILLGYSFNENFINLYGKKEIAKNGQGQSRRSEALYTLALMCIEHGLSDTETYVLLVNKDKQWGKFKDRADKRQRYLDLVKIAREKTAPKKEDGVEAPQAPELPPLLGWKALAAFETKGDWIIEDVWLDYTMNALLGIPGLGKTQMSMRFGMALALGREQFLDFAIPKQKRVLFLSLELNAFGIQRFQENMNNSLSDKEQDGLEEHFRIWAPGVPLDLTTPYGQDVTRNLIEDSKAEVVFIDSMGSAAPGALNNIERMADLLRFNDQLNSSGIGTWFVSHPRKIESTGAAARRPTLHDLFGDQSQGARARGVYGLHGNTGNSIELLRLKQSFAKPTNEIRIIERTSDLDFRILKYGTLDSKGNGAKSKIDGLLNHYSENSDQLIDDGLGSI